MRYLKKFNESKDMSSNLSFSDAIEIIHEIISIMDYDLNHQESIKFLRKSDDNSRISKSWENMTEFSWNQLNWDLISIPFAKSDEDHQYNGIQKYNKYLEMNLDKLEELDNKLRLMEYKIDAYTLSINTDRLSFYFSIVKV